MGGKSLLHGSPPSLRPIFSANIKKAEITGEGLMAHNYASTPPFFQFDYFTAIVCNKWVKLTTSDNQWTTGTLDSEPGLCSGAKVPSATQMEKELLDQLKRDGFDVSSVKMDE
jgi:hypothetical protein